MRTIINFLVISFMLIVNTGYSQTFEWAQTTIGFSNSGEKEIAVDRDGAGNVYIMGTLYGTITFGSITLYGIGDIYIAKYDLAGVIQWAVKADGTNYLKGYEIACDNAGNSYITGTYIGTATFGTTTLNSLGGRDIFVAKYNTSGNCLWAKYAGSTSSEWGLTIAIDNSGNSYVAGNFLSTISFGSSSVTSNGSSDIFLAKYTSAGNFDWAVSGGSGNHDEFAGVTVDPAGNIYLNGTINETANFSGLILVPDGESDNFIIKYNSNGTLARGNTEDGYDAIGIGVDNNNDSYTLSSYTISKHTSTGNPDWTRSWTSTGIIYGLDIKTDFNGNNYVCGIYYGTASFPPYSIVSSGGTDIFVAKYNSDGEIQWVNSSGGPGTAYARDISADLAGNAYIAGEYSISENFGNTILNSRDGIDAFVAKISGGANLITGKVYFDYDNNGIRDMSSEPVYPNIVVSSSPGSSMVSSNTSGDYYSFCGSGSNSVSILFPPLYYTPNLVSHSINFSGYGNISENNDFGLYPTPNINDLRVTLTDAARARPGFRTTQLLTYKNVGTTTLSGSITILFDNDELNFISSNPAEYSVASNLITWNYSNISPNEERRILIEYSLPASVPIGTHLTSTVTINPISGDYAPADNIYNLNQVVTGSFDPNDKSVEPVSNLSLQNIQDEDSLTYTIRFQNTGTDTAFTVKVTDTLSSKLNIPTVETISSSHDYNFSIKNGNILIWTFNNILLPDSTTNEVLSHGFIKYKIKPKNNLVIGDVITNSANIYFDYNEPVITNTTVTEIEENTSFEFAPKVDFASGINPISVCSGDIDGDGKSDLAVANLNSNTLSLLRNTSTLGNISFAEKVDFTTGEYPRCVSIGDIDGDGKLDLVVANYNSNTVSVFRNTSVLGSISFAAKVDFATGINPRIVSIGDIDGDSKPDLAVANNNSNTVSVLRNESAAGTVNFAAKIDFETGSLPNSVSIGNLDADGKPDLAVANYNSNTVSVFRNISTLGNISFTAKVDFTTGTNPYDVKIGDLNGDGKSELAVSNNSNISNSISVFRNTSVSGSISFAAKIDFITGVNPNNLSIGDLDGDGKSEITVSNTNSNTLSLLRNTSAAGSISFSAKKDFATGTNPYSVCIVDLDGNTKPDIAAVNRGSNTISVIRNTGSFSSSGFILNLSLLIQGAYNSELNTMVSDTVRVYLRNSFSPFSIVDSSASVVDINGTGVFTFLNGVSNETPYYISVKHRNSIETWSASGQSFTSNQLSYNFTNTVSKAYGNNMILKGSKYCIFSGDVTQDGFVELSDVVLIFNDASNFVTGYVRTDVNGDNLSDLSDALIAFNNSKAFVSKVTP